MTTGLAPDAEDTWTALRAGESGVRHLGDALPQDVDLPTRMGAGLREQIGAGMTRVELRRLSYLQQMALMLGRRAWRAADSPDVDTARLGVCIGTGFGTVEDIIVAYHDMRARGLRAVSPLHVQMFMPNGAAATVGLELKAKAGVTAPMMGDASGAAAVAEAWRHMVMGDADVMICGGVETRVESVPIAAYAQLDRVLSTADDDPAAACRPFDRDRTGMVFGEGGAMLVLETEAHARARGATVLARLLGAATTSDGYDLVANDPDAEQAASAVTQALRQAGLEPDDVDHVNAHAIGSVAGDLAEAVALRKALGSAHPAVYAPKAALGHTFGSAGAIEAVLTAFALRDGVIPPTLNLDHLDPAIDLDVVAGAPRTGRLNHAVSTSFGFGGHNVVLVFGRP